MRILHISDIHCNRRMLRRVLDEALKHKPDVIAVTGDVCCDGEILDMLRSTNTKTLVVTGNMDDIYIARLFRDAGWLLDGQVEEYNGYLFCGIGGLQPIQDINSLERKLEGADTTRLIVLAHHPVHGYLDITWSGVHAGLYETLDFVKKYKPIVYLHGHIHEARGIARHGRTLLVNAGPAAHGYYAIVDVTENRAEAKLHSVR